MSYWTNTQEKKEKNSSSTLLCVTFWNGKKKELEGTVVIMETAGFSFFIFHTYSSRSFLAKDLMKNIQKLIMFCCVHFSSFFLIFFYSE